MDYDIVSNSPHETIETGTRIGRQLKGSEIVAVCGALGSGKTHLIKGIARGAGIENYEHVNSPTFVMVNEYTASSGLDIYHVDAYRLGSLEEFEMLGFDDFCYPHSVVLIEWADKIEPALEGIDYIRAELAHSGESRRNIRLENLPGHIVL